MRRTCGGKLAEAREVCDNESGQWCPGRFDVTKRYGFLDRLLCFLAGRHGSTESITISYEGRIVVRVWRCMNCGTKDWTVPGWPQ
jgi:hypothetical protein